MPIMVKRMRIGQTDVGLVRNGMKTDIWIENMKRRQDKEDRILGDGVKFLTLCFCVTKCRTSKFGQ